MSESFIELDGSFGEGGGQILRSSLALALLTGKPVRLHNIRAGRPKPGLQAQHLMSVRAAGTVGRASMLGASLGSSELEFRPAVVLAGDYRFDIGTAGATSLVLHTIYLPLALRGSTPSKLTLTGGTHVMHSPSFHFLQTTWRPYLALCGLRLSLNLVRPGFYPRGGGVVEAVIEPSPGLKGMTLSQRGEVKVTGLSAVAGLPEHVVQRQARRAHHRLRDLHGMKVDIDEETWPGGPGSVLALTVHTTPVPALFLGLGERGKPAEKVADEAVAEVNGYLAAAPAAVDPYSGDQILLPLALAQGPSEYSVAEVTQHLLTNITVIRRFLDREIVCEGEEGRPGVVRIT
jgi:RNA 3'-terminal phosphate cyclase (ATP)